MNNSTKMLIALVIILISGLTVIIMNYIYAIPVIFVWFSIGYMLKKA